MMKLERLIATREGISTKSFPISTKELLGRYERLYTGAVSDVLREYTLMDQSIGHLLAMQPNRPVAGIAFTVKSEPHMLLTGEMKFRSQVLDAMVQDSFVMWDASGDKLATLWGGVMTAAAKAKGVRAAMIDGGIRDSYQILEKRFPVFYRYHVPNGSLGRCLITHYQVPILIQGAIIKPGDVVLGDIDGVVVVPREIAYEILVRAEEIQKNEKKIFNWVMDGQSIRQISANGGYF